MKVHKTILKACQLALAVARGEQPDPPQRVLPCPLVVRDSTARPR